MDDPLARLLALQQIERHHQNRLDTVWSQFKDAWVIIQALELGMLGFAVAFPNLTIAGREGLIILIVVFPFLIGLPMRADAERRAGEISADYEAEFRSITQAPPPRPLIGRAMRLVKGAPRSRAGVALVPLAEE